MRIMSTIIFLALLLPAGAVLLQLWLSRRESRWAGLVLPILSFLLSLLIPLSLILPSEGVTVRFVLSAALSWLAANTPTAVLLLIYFSCREKQRRSRQLQQMNIQDLG